MAQKLRKSALMFGQVVGTPPDQEKPTLSGFYGGVGAGQVGAVQQVGEGVRTETSKLPTTFGGVTETTDETGKTIYKLGEGAAGAPFTSTVVRPTVDLKTTGSTDVVATVDKDTGNIVYKDKTGKIVEGPTATQVGEWSAAAASNVGELQDAQTKEEADLQDASTKASEKAGETIKEQQEKLTEGKLGERRAPSELEKQAQDYRNILVGTPGTSNVKAVANLMKFYDIGKYGALESGLRQGEIALARKEAGTTEAGMETAEGARTGAIEEFEEATQENYDKLTKAIEQDKQDKLKQIKDYYSSEIGKQQSIAETTKAKADELAKVEKEAEDKKDEIANNQRISLESEIFGDPFNEDPNKVAGALTELREKLGPETNKVQEVLDDLNDMWDWQKATGHTKRVQDLEQVLNEFQEISKQYEAIERLLTKARIDKNMDSLKKHYEALKALRGKYANLQFRSQEVISNAHEPYRGD